MGDGGVCNFCGIGPCQCPAEDWEYKFYIRNIAELLGEDTNSSPSLIAAAVEKLLETANSSIAKSKVLVTMQDGEVLEIFSDNHNISVVVRNYDIDEDEIGDLEDFELEDVYESNLHLDGSDPISDKEYYHEIEYVPEEWDLHTEPFENKVSKNTEEWGT